MLPLGVTRHCFRKSKAGAKPTLLRGYDPALILPPGSPELKVRGNDWQKAELVVTSCCKFCIRNYGSIQDDAVGFDKRTDGETGAEGLYECTVQLVTGRTHQIRLQACASGSPIIGDTRYSPVQGLLDDGPDTAWGNGSAIFGAEPGCIALQASRLDFELVEGLNLEFEGNFIRAGGDGASFCAPEPWWHHLRQLEKVMQDTALDARVPED